METTTDAAKPAIGFPFIPVLMAIAVIAVLLALVFSSGSLAGFFGLQPKETGNSIPLVRQQYFQEAFQPKRTEYKLFEAASKFTGKPLGELPAFFALSSEQEIWEELPPIPKDFSEIAYMLVTGNFFAIENLGEGYYKQPEFYPNFTNPKGGLRWWREPDPRGWATGGYGTYPSEQWATMKKGETENFKATVFLYNSFGVQTYQGGTLFMAGDYSKYFDITISPQTFLLEPTFPKFKEEWVKKITIQGSLKQGTPKGEYTIPILIGTPPEEKNREWTAKYRNLYQNAAASVKPSGNPIELHIKVE